MAHKCAQMDCTNGCTNARTNVHKCTVGGRGGVLVCSKCVIPRRFIVGGESTSYMCCTNAFAQMGAQMLHKCTNAQMEIAAALRPPSLCYGGVEQQPKSDRWGPHG